MDGGAWRAAVHGVEKSRTRLSDFTLTFHFHALEKEMATHSSVLAWRIPGTGEPGGLPSRGSHRVGHDWSDLAAAAILYIDHLSVHFQWTKCSCYSFFLLSYVIFCFNSVFRNAVLCLFEILDSVSELVFGVPLLFSFHFSTAFPYFTFQKFIFHKTLKLESSFLYG